MVDERATRRRFLVAAGATFGAGVSGCFSPPAAEQSQVEASSESGSQQEPLGEQQEGDSVYSRVYEETIDSVVLVRVYGGVYGQGTGTGFVYDDEHLLTNHHVVGGSDDVELQYSAGEWRSASIVASDPYSDLAVLETPDRSDYATPLSLSESDPVVGQEVVALGNPLGLNASVSRGIVSGVNRSLPSPAGFSIPDAIQTDAAVNPGNSGGPMVNLDGGVEGVIFAGGGQNIGFGISSALTRRVVPRLIEDGEYEHSYVGVLLTEVTPSIAEANDLDRSRGVIVTEVLPDTPADDALQGSDGQSAVNGISVPVGGDVVIEIEGVPIPNQNELSSYLSLETSPGDTIEITVIRDGTRQTVELTLTSRPDP